MQALTLESGVPSKRYHKVMDSVRKCDDTDQLLNMENWLREARDGVYAKALRIKVRHSQEVWDRYKTLGFTTLNEVIVLGKALKELRAFWKEPYNVKLEKNQSNRKQVRDEADKPGDESSN